MQQPLAWLREDATASALIAGNRSGLTVGNWYCASGGRRCHYGGHHEGFHHLYYWDLDRGISVAMLTNNTLAPALQQRLLVAFAEGRAVDAQRELAEPLADVPVISGTYLLPTGESVTLRASGEQLAVTRGAIAYQAYLIGQGIRYVPGLDLYVSGAPAGGLHWLTLYEDFVARPQ